MAFTKRNVKDRLVQYPRRYQMVEVQPGIFDLIPVPGTITEEGTPINKAYLQPIEDSLEVALEKNGDGKDVTVTFTEAATEAHIANGEKLSVMFGKILKKFKSIVPISLGGTGASTVAGARNALGLGNTTGALPVANGGTGSTTAANARTALGVPPTAHASTGTSYGVGNASNYGHVKVRNDLVGTETSGATVSPAQITALKGSVDGKTEKATLLSTHTLNIGNISAQNINLGTVISPVINEYDIFLIEFNVNFNAVNEPYYIGLEEAASDLINGAATVFGTNVKGQVNTTLFKSLLNGETIQLSKLTGYKLSAKLFNDITITEYIRSGGSVSGTGTVKVYGVKLK